MNFLNWKISLPLGLLLALLPVASRADVANIGALVLPALGFAVTFWTCLTIAAFLGLRRRLTLGKRIITAALLFVSPVLWIALLLFEEYAFGEYYKEVTEISREPVQVVSATFPPGSRVHYAQTGGFFGWHAQRTLIDIQSSQAVSLGSLRIDGLRPKQYSSELRLSLSENQTLDGWPCAAGEYTIVDATSNGYELMSCWLASPHEWHGKAIPVGTNVSRNGNDDWLFAEMYKPSRSLPNSSEESDTETSEALEK